MPHPIRATKNFVKENKVGIAVVSTITVVYGGLAVMSYYNYKTIELQYEIAQLEIR